MTFEKSLAMFSRKPEAKSLPEWQPIETAPRNGKWILVWWPDITDCALLAYRGPDGWRCPIGSYEGYIEGKYGKPTHWMPLPSPPQQSDQ